MKYHFTFCLFLSCIALFSCQSDLTESEPIPTLELDQTITINGEVRNYHIQTPADPTNKPIVILLHGHGGSSDQSIGAEISKAPQQVWLTLA